MRDPEWARTHEHGQGIHCFGQEHEHVRVPGRGRIPAVGTGTLVLKVFRPKSEYGSYNRGYGPVQAQPKPMGKYRTTRARELPRVGHGHHREALMVASDRHALFGCLYPRSPEKRAHGQFWAFPEPVLNLLHGPVTRVRGFG